MKLPMELFAGACEQRFATSKFRGGGHSLVTRWWAASGHKARALLASNPPPQGLRGCPPRFETLDSPKVVNAPLFPRRVCAGRGRGERGKRSERVAPFT